MRLECKDERFRLTFTNVHLAWPPSVNGSVVVPAYDGPVNRQKDFDKIKPKLLEFGPEIINSLAKAKDGGNW